MEDAGLVGLEGVHVGIFSMRMVRRCERATYWAKWQV